MGRIIIEDIDDAVIERLSELAQLHNHSLAEEARIVLEEAVLERNPNWCEEILKIQEKLKGLKFSDSAELIREDRDTR